MNRRYFLSLLASIPVVGPLLASQSAEQTHTMVSIGDVEIRHVRTINIHQAVCGDGWECWQLLCVAKPDRDTRKRLVCEWHGDVVRCFMGATTLLEWRISECQLSVAYDREEVRIDVRRKFRSAEGCST